MLELNSEDKLYQEVSQLISKARKSLVQRVNVTMTETYFRIGELIVEEEQEGKDRAGYGKNLINRLSERLTEEYGRGFSSTNLKQMRTFYTVYSKGQKVSDEFKLSWSHYLILMRLDNIEERNFYEIESISNNWSLRELQRQFNSALYERLVLSRDKEGVKELSKKGQIVDKAQDAIKDPYVLEFLGLPEKSIYSETELEEKLINQLEEFLLE